MQGACLCGGVRFTLTPPLRDVIACHCSQCRKTRRGFCASCGASLFWEPVGENRISIAAGALDGETGLTLAEDWFLEDAGDYYHGPSEAPETLTGSCLCGANHFTLRSPMSEVTACHCHQCRKLSGHFSASFDTDEAALTWQARDTAEYATPNGGKRSFCPTCGSSLTFRDRHGNFSVEAGVIDNPTGGRLTSHIFSADKGDYYALTDGLPQTPGP
jgi:hypothetical protein